MKDTGRFAILGLPGAGEVTVANIEGEVLGHLVAVEFRPDGHADLGRCPDAGALAANLGFDARQRPLGRRQQFRTLAGPLVGLSLP